MTLIATETNDSPARLSAMAAAQRGRPGYAIDAYFYRSQVVYRKELDQILYKSWLYAGHVSQVANPGDYFTYELGETPLSWCGTARAESTP